MLYSGLGLLRLPVDQPNAVHTPILPARVIRLFYALTQNVIITPMHAHPPEQLTMVIAADAVRCLADVPLPDGYVVRAYRQGDIASWAVALQRGGFETWGEAQVLEFLEVAERREGSRLVEHDGRIVASTFASRISNRPPMTSASGIDPSEEGVIDYVVTHPDHRGKGLGRATCTEVSRFLVARGCKAVSLNTDDWRLPAIHLYLSMGFQPVMYGDDMPARWAAVYQKLKESGREYP